MTKDTRSAVDTYRQARTRIQQELCSGYHAVLYADDALAELEAELWLVNAVNATFRHDLEQAEATIEELDICYRREIDDHNKTKDELMRVKLKLIFVEEWFDNILPNDYDLCMKRWAEREQS